MPATNSLFNDILDSLNPWYRNAATYRGGQSFLIHVRGIHAPKSQQPFHKVDVASLARQN